MHFGHLKCATFYIEFEFINEFSTNVVYQILIKSQVDKIKYFEKCELWLCSNKLATSQQLT